MATRALPSFVSARATLAIILLSALPYLNTLHGDCVYDDKVAVMGNPDVTIHTVPISELFLHDFWGNRMRITLPDWLGINTSFPESPWTHNSYRPLTVLTIRFNDWLAPPSTGSNVHSKDTTVFHVTNILIHVLACLAGMYALTALLGRSRRFHACLAAMLFAAHPVHTEVVANITSRAETLGAIFALAAVGVYFHITNPRARGSQAGVVSSFFACILATLLVVIAVLCKETALVILAMIAALDVIVNTPDEPQPETPRRWASSFFSYVKHLLLNAHWFRVVTLLVLQVLLLYVRVSILSSGYVL